MHINYVNLKCLVIVIHLFDKYVLITYSVKWYAKHNNEYNSFSQKELFNWMKVD